MIPLNRKEILLELSRFGINNTSELNSCLKKYKKYYRLHKTASQKKEHLKRNN